jgi:hypothetical protein
MSVHPLRPNQALRELFDQVVELSPEVREARIASLDLPTALSVRLQAMVVFDEIVELAPALRKARIAELDLPDAVRARLHAMLAADTTARTLVKASRPAVVERFAGDADEALGQSLVGTCIGNFRLREVIGQGGSSVVFRAEREAGDGSQVVALKLLRTGLYSAVPPAFHTSPWNWSTAYRSRRRPTRAA